MRNLGSILFINGKVKFPITIDPLVWIFDDRKVEIDTYFNKEAEKVDEIEDYTKKAATILAKGNPRRCHNAAYIKNRKKI